MAKGYVLYNPLAGNGNAGEDAKLLQMVLDEDLEYYEHLENGRSLDFEYCHGKKDGVNEAIEIVKEEGGIE